MLNIPARVLSAPLDGYGHGGVDLPTERKLTAHTDNLYALPLLLDPTIDPNQIFNLGHDDYDARLADILARPVDTSAWQTKYYREFYAAALAHPTIGIVEVYWDGLLTPGRSLQGELEANGYSPAEALTLVSDAESTLQSMISAFEADHATAIEARRQEIIALGGDPARAGLEIYQQVNNDWRQERLSPE